MGPVYPTETPYLFGRNFQNVRLSCQVKVKKNIKINIPEELFNIRQYETVIDSIIDLTYDIKEIHFNLPENENVSFRPGQYLQFEAPPYEKG